MLTLTLSLPLARSVTRTRSQRALSVPSRSAASRPGAQGFEQPRAFLGRDLLFLDHFQDTHTFI